MRGLQTKARFDSLADEGITSAYDGFGRLLWTNTNLGGPSRTLRYLYDAAGNRTRVIWPNGGYVTYEHDAAGRMAAATGNSGTVLATFACDAFGRRQGLATPGTLTGYAYDGASRLAALPHELSGPASDEGLTRGKSWDGNPFHAADRGRRRQPICSRCAAPLETLVAGQLEDR